MAEIQRTPRFLPNGDRASFPEKRYQAPHLLIFLRSKPLLKPAKSPIEYNKPIRKRPFRTSRVKMDACQTYTISKLGTSSKGSDQSARVSPEMVVSVWPSVRFFM